MSVETIPGTVLPRKDYPDGVFEQYRPLLYGAGGLTLAQVCGITGLETSTVQNWVKRGLVAKTVNNRYGERQLSRILIINALRSAMLLDDVVGLLAYLNGSVEDAGDDIIPESRLFDYLWQVMDRWVNNSCLDLESLGGVVDSIISDYDASPQWREKLREALQIMSLACAASKLRDLSDSRLDGVLEKKKKRR